MPIKDHTHRLRRAPIEESKPVRYFCTLPDCSFKEQRELLVGKLSLCNECGSAVTLRLKHELRRKIIKCPLCSKTEEGRKMAKVKNLASELELDLTPATVEE